jgi:hypothetical protein
VDHFLKAVSFRNHYVFSLFPTGNTCAENLDIGVAECFCLTGRERTQGSGGASAVKYQKPVLILWENGGTVVLEFSIRK